MKIIAFAASTSTKSINKQLVTYAVNLIDEFDSEILDLNDYELPLFSEDAEQKYGQPTAAKAFLEKLKSADAIVISFAEHNGSYSAAYKNLFDWCSRIEPKVYQNKSMALFSTSPGGRGGASVLAAAVHSAPFFNGLVRASLAVPEFYKNFDTENQRVNNQQLEDKIIETLKTLLN